MGVVMTNWFPDIESKKGPRYLAIADAIGEGINNGSLKAGERLPVGGNQLPPL